MESDKQISSSQRLKAHFSINHIIRAIVRLAALFVDFAITPIKSWITPIFLTGEQKNKPDTMAEVLQS